MLRKHGRGRRRPYHHRQRQTFAIAVVLAGVLLAGCKSDKELKRRYAETQHQLQDGLYDAAIHAADNALRETAKEDPAWSWRFRLLEAEGLLRSGATQPSIDLLQQNVPGNLPRDIVLRRTILIGRAFCRNGNGDQGNAKLNEVEREIPSSASQLRAELAFAKGQCSFSKQAIAEDFFRQASKLAQGVDPFLASSALVNAGYLAMNSGNCAGAIELFNQALPLTDSRLVQEKTKGNLSICYARLGDYRKAIELSREAVDTARELGQADDEASWLLSLGHSQSSLHEFGVAEGTLLQGLEIARRVHDTDTEHDCLNNLTHLAIRSHDLSKAEKYWQEEAMTPKGRSDPYSLLNHEELEVSRRRYGPAEVLLKQILGLKISDVLRAVAQGELGSVYAAQGKYSLAEKMFTQGVETAERARKQVPEGYRIAFLDADEFYDGYVRFLVQRNQKLRALQVAEQSRARTLMEGLSPEWQPAEFNLKTVQAVLRQKHASLMSYWVTDKSSFLWVITPSEFKWFPLPGHERLFEQVKAANDEIQARREIQKAEKGKALYNTLVQPAAKLVPKGSRVIIIPSRVLCLVAFDSLVVPGKKSHYWIEDVEMERASALALLNTSGHSASPFPKDLLLIGAPLEVNPKDFPALRHAGQEMELIQRRFASERSAVFSGKDATPQTYLSSNPQQYRYIHFVTHGTADEQNPMRSVIVLSGTREDYMLYAGKIIKTPIHAELVTISACYGAGLRWYLNESTVGLAWAFMRAGAHQVVAALWEVDDAGTPELMNQFYGQLNSGKTPAEALRAVKLQMIGTRGPHKLPYFWSSLQLYTGA